jgi:hypothetical protein
MVDDKDSMQLSECCFSARDKLKNAIRGDNSSGLNESEKVPMGDLES